MLESQSGYREHLFLMHGSQKSQAILPFVLLKTQNVNYSSDRLPAIHVSQKDAVQKFKSLYSSAKIKSISLTLRDNIYLYNITGYDNLKDCSIQIDATNNKILGQSTQIFDYDYDDETTLNLNKTISRSRANKIANQEIGGGTPIFWELTDDNDRAIWKVNLVQHGQKRTVKIDARNGDVI